MLIIVLRPKIFKITDNIQEANKWVGVIVRYSLTEIA